MALGDLGMHCYENFGPCLNETLKILVSAMKLAINIHQEVSNSTTFLKFVGDGTSFVQAHAGVKRSID